MTEHQFWHEDMRLLGIYQKAYLRDRKETSYLQAQYFSLATEVAVSNALASKKSDKKQFADIIKYEDPFKKFEKKQETITQDNLENKFRQDMLSQQSWLRDILKK